MATAPIPQPENWNAHMPRLNDEALMLAEMTHRVANEVAAAQAAIRLAIAKRDTPAGGGLIRAALGRLEGFGEVLQALNVSPDAEVDLGASMRRMCEGLCMARLDVSRDGCVFDTPSVWVSGDVARRMMMIAAELVQNAIRYALAGSEGKLAVVLRGDADELRLAVVDNGPGIDPGAAPSGTGMGRPIVRELVRRAQGAYECESGPDGTRVRIALPTGMGRNGEAARQ